MDVKDILTNKMTPENIDILSGILEKMLEACPEYKDDFYVLENGYHFNLRSLHESQIEIKYPWSEIEKHMDALNISFPPCVTQEDVVYTVNSLYWTYFPLISDITGAIRFAEKYIEDKNWPDHNRPYLEWLGICH